MGKACNHIFSVAIDNMTNDGRWNYLLQDHLGSTVGLADNGGTVTESNSYNSFGNPSNSSFSTRYQFTGREFDSFSGLQYSRARFYDPQIGRFISEDPIGFRGGDVNLYGYVRNKPLKYRDPFGKDIFGISGSGNLFIGGGQGSGVTASTLVGYSTDDNDLGAAFSYGGFAHFIPSCRNGRAFGGSASVGAGAFWSPNANRWDDFSGDFDNHQFGLGPFGSFEASYGTTSDGRPITVYQYSPPFTSVGGSYGYTKFKTYTPPAGIVSANSISSVAAGNIENLYGRKGCRCP